MQTLNFYKVCNSWIAVSRACGIILFLAWYFVSKELLGVPRVKFLKYLRFKVIAIDWFLIYLIRQKEIDTTSQLFYENWWSPNQDNIIECTWFFVDK